MRGEPPWLNLSTVSLAISLLSPHRPLRWRRSSRHWWAIGHRPADFSECWRRRFRRPNSSQRKTSDESWPARTYDHRDLTQWGNESTLASLVSLIRLDDKKGSAAALRSRAPNDVR